MATKKISKPIKTLKTVRAAKPKKIQKSIPKAQPKAQKLPQPPTVSRKTPVNKPSKIEVLPQHTRIQTAEGWKRDQIKLLKERHHS